MEENKKSGNGVTENANIESTKKKENVTPTKANKNGRIAIVLLIIGLVLIGIACYKLFVEKPNTNEQEDTNIQEKENNNQTNNVIEISKKVKINNDALYIGSKKVTGVEFRVLDKDSVYDLGDLTLVSDCVSDCKSYFIDDDTNVVGTIGKVEGTTFNALITPKYDNAQVLVVTGKDVYIWSYNYDIQDASSVCSRKRDEEISVTEKYTYNGNKQFSNPQINNSNTVESFIATSGIHCE